MTASCSNRLHGNFYKDFYMDKEGFSVARFQDLPSPSTYGAGFQDHRNPVASSPGFQDHASTVASTIE